MRSFKLDSYLIAIIKIAIIITQSLISSYSYSYSYSYSLSYHSFIHRNTAKIQKLHGQLQLLETLTLQLSREKQSYHEELTLLQRQVRDRQQLVNWERQQYELTLEMDRRVKERLDTLLNVSRSVNVDILQSHCFLEKVPSKAELLFVGML